MNAVELEGDPSNYFVQVGSNMFLLNMYVDDLTLSGDATLHRAFWQEMRKHINIEPEAKKVRRAHESLKEIIVPSMKYKPHGCTLT